jgi:hypothetical protein
MPSRLIISKINISVLSGVAGFLDLVVILWCILRNVNDSPRVLYAIAVIPKKDPPFSGRVCV